MYFKCRTETIIRFHSWRKHNYVIFKQKDTSIQMKFAFTSDFSSMKKRKIMKTKACKIFKYLLNNLLKMN